MNTGSGKTLVGLLMLQSLLNEEIGPALYLCPTKQLVEQAYQTAREVGIPAVTDGVRDGTPREDASRIRTGSATETMTILRNIIVFLFHRGKHKSSAAATRHDACHPEKSLEVLSTPSLRMKRPWRT